MDALLDDVHRVATAKKVPISLITHELHARDLIGRPAARTDRSILALCETGWEDLTGICDISPDAKTERRLMRAPSGEFHLVSEKFDVGNDVWRVTTEEITPAKARDFYLRNCIPECLAEGFYEWESPSLRLDTLIDETAALTELVAHLATDESPRADLSRGRLKVGIANLVRGASERLREAGDAL